MFVSNIACIKTLLTRLLFDCVTWKFEYLIGVNILKIRFEQTQKSVVSRINNYDYPVSKTKTPIKLK